MTYLNLYSHTKLENRWQREMQKDDWKRQMTSQAIADQVWFWGVYLFPFNTQLLMITLYFGHIISQNLPCPSHPSMAIPTSRTNLSTSAGLPPTVSCSPSRRHLQVALWYTLSATHWIHSVISCTCSWKMGLWCMSLLVAWAMCSRSGPRYESTQMSWWLFWLCKLYSLISLSCNVELSVRRFCESGL